MRALRASYWFLNLDGNFGVSIKWSIGQWLFLENFIIKMSIRPGTQWFGVNQTLVLIWQLNNAGKYSKSTPAGKLVRVPHGTLPSRTSTASGNSLSPSGLTPAMSDDVKETVDIIFKETPSIFARRPSKKLSGHKSKCLSRSHRFATPHIGFHDQGFQVFMKVVTLSKCSTMSFYKLQRSYKVAGMAMFFARLSRKCHFKN